MVNSCGVVSLSEGRQQHGETVSEAAGKATHAKKGISWKEGRKTGKKREENKKEKRLIGDCEDF